MTPRSKFRPYIAADPKDAPRESGTVNAVAAHISAHKSQVRRLVESGEFESYTLGKRGVRIYWDSVAAYQGRNARPVQREANSPKPRRQPKPASVAASRAARAALQAAGIGKTRPWKTQAEKEEA